MKIIKVLVMLFVLVLSSAAEPLDFQEIIKNKKINFIKIEYRVSKDSESLSQIYKVFVKDNSIVSINHPMVVKTIKENPKITFSNLKKSERFNLYISVDLIDWDKLSAYQLNVRKLKKMDQQSLDRVKQRLDEHQLRYSFFYMASYGRFIQDDPSSINVTFLQNSPVSLGVSASFYPKDRPYNFSGSLYYSYLLTALIEQSNDEVKVDPEIGGNLYFSYRLNYPSISLYSGLDFEKFNTFNIENLKENNLVTFDTNKVTYLTIGMSKSLTLFGKKLFTKLSYSHSILSSRSSSYNNSNENVEMNGSKVLFYLFKNIGNNFFAHSLVKYHWMSGASDISALRVGVGFGYIL